MTPYMQTQQFTLENQIHYDIKGDMKNGRDE